MSLSFNIFNFQTVHPPSRSNGIRIKWRTSAAVLRCLEFFLEKKRSLHVHHWCLNCFLKHQLLSEYANRSEVVFPFEGNKIRAANAFHTLRARKASKSWEAHRIQQSELTAPPNWKISALICHIFTLKNVHDLPKSQVISPTPLAKTGRSDILEFVRGGITQLPVTSVANLNLHLALEFSRQAHPNMIKYVYAHVWDHVIPLTFPNLADILRNQMGSILVQCYISIVLPISGSLFYGVPNWFSGKRWKTSTNLFDQNVTFT